MLDNIVPGTVLFRYGRYAFVSSLEGNLRFSVECSRAALCADIAVV
ncbi:MAG: hypothetical protein ACLFVJ_22070 [Persicimonas sp.]